MKNWPVVFYDHLRIDTSGWALCKKNGDISGSDQGILLTYISNESLFFLYLLIYHICKRYLYYENREFITKFSTFIFLTWISRLILDLHIPNLRLYRRHSYLGVTFVIFCIFFQSSLFYIT